MRIAIILNGISLEKDSFYKKILPGLSATFTVEVFETIAANDALSLASKAVEKRFDVILAAGGDGTLHQVLNGILRDREDHKDLPILGAIPVGTGNDFARALKIQKDVDQLIALLQNLKPKEIDIGKVHYTSTIKETEERYFINVADIGMGPEVVKKVMASDRAFGASLSYYFAIISTFSQYKVMTVHAIADDWKWSGKLRTLAIANGNYYGHGMNIAPDALPNDKIFDVFIAGNVSALFFMLKSHLLKQGKKVIHPEVLYRKTTTIELSSESPCTIEADGEILGLLPARIEMMKQTIKFLC
ncbi:MAG TPA: diacylglycerol kinase family lipid kinase [Chryseolinea sp.]|nr:diacylglycerol kinase family lipid kinase [Chryseolinea sp.]HPM28762.1 diacylglycerol kinase family lipid kinase [Chryseolinea sp.]